MIAIESLPKSAPLDMGDIFLVDSGSLGITIKSKGEVPMDLILKQWEEGEKDKQLAFEDMKTITFFNKAGTEDLVSWLILKRLLIR